MIRHFTRFLRVPANSQRRIAPKQRASVIIPFSPNAALKNSTSLHSLLYQPALVIGRQFEMLNTFLGFEQQNRYIVYNSAGEEQGTIIESGTSILNALMRQVLRTKRPFKADLIIGEEIALKMSRPFQWWNSRISVQVDGKVVGEVHQRFHIFRRQYDLFVKKDGQMRQFGEIDAPWLSWDFHAHDDNGNDIAVINKNFTGFAREIFTDTSHYILRMDELRGLTDEEIRNHGRSMGLNERAVMLSCAVTIDIDYFSRHSRHGTMGWLPFYWGSDE